MPNAPVSQIWPNGQLNHPGTQPGNSVGHFRRRFRERSIIGRITNRNYDASQFKGRGSVLTIPDTPVITTRKTRMGQPVEYEEIKTGAHFMVIDRERYWGVKIEDEDKIFANFDIESPIVQEADQQLAEDTEDELVSDVLYKTHEANQGAHAGIKSGIYNLGTALSPVTLYKTEAARNGRAGAIATDHFQDFSAVIGEQPGGVGPGAFILCPTAVANVLAKSEMRRADWMGTAQSLLRRPVEFLGDVGGMTVIASNRLPIFPAAGGSPAVFPILFGDKRAISFAEIFRFRDKMTDIREWGSFHRAKMIYDWYIDRSEFIGVSFVTIGTPAVNG